MNYLAILVSAVAAMVVGFVWYGPLFGSAWMRAMGKDPNDKAEMDRMKKSAGPAYGAMFVGALVTAVVLACFIDRLEITNYAGGMGVAALAWLGFIVPLRLGDMMFEGKNKNLFWISIGYQLVNLIVMGAILGGWR